MSMKPTDTNPLPNADVEQSLELLRDQLDQDPVEPPAMIDQAIRNMAHREVEKRKSPLRWLSGLATAAILVLAVSIVLQQQPGPVEMTTEPPETQLLEESSDFRMERKAPAAPVPQSNTIPEPTARRNAVPAPPPPALAEPKAEARSAVEADTMDVRQEMAPAEESEAPLMDAGVVGLSAVRKDEPAPWRQSPEAWVERLIELRQQGDEEQFIRERDALMEAFPDFEMPADLQAASE